MTEPGNLIGHEPLATEIAGAKAWRIRYVSRDVNGVAHEATGLVIVPAGDGENRPIMTWCHGTTGLGGLSRLSLATDQPDGVRPVPLQRSPKV